MGSGAARDANFAGREAEKAGVQQRRRDASADGHVQRRLSCSRCHAPAPFLPSAAVRCLSLLCADQLLPLHGVPSAALPLALPLSGTTEEERYGRRYEPSWPSPSQPYSWRPLLCLREQMPASWGPAAPAAPMPAHAARGPAAEGNQQGPAQPMLPRHAFQVAVKVEEAEGSANAPAGPRAGTTRQRQQDPAGEAAEGDAMSDVEAAAGCQLEKQPGEAQVLSVEQQQAKQHHEPPAEGEEDSSLQQRQDVQQELQQAEQRPPEAAEAGAEQGSRGARRRRDYAGPVLNSLQAPLPVVANEAVLVAGKSLQRQVWKLAEGEPARPPPQQHNSCSC